MEYGVGGANWRSLDGHSVAKVALVGTGSAGRWSVGAILQMEVTNNLDIFLHSVVSSGSIICASLTAPLLPSLRGNAVRITIVLSFHVGQPSFFDNHHTSIMSKSKVLLLGTIDQYVLCSDLILAHAHHSQLFQCT